MNAIPRADWQAVSEAFVAFFDGLGSVDADGESLLFVAPGEGTGLSLGRDGTSSSFMPLHGLDARWESVTFDPEERTAVVAGFGFTYTYRVPPGLVRR